MKCIKSAAHGCRKISNPKGRANCFIAYASSGDAVINKFVYVAFTHENKPNCHLPNQFEFKVGTN